MASRCFGSLDNIAADAGEISWIKSTLFSTAFCPTTPAICALTSEPPVSPPDTVATADDRSLMLALTLSGKRFGSISPVLGSMASGY